MTSSKVSHAAPDPIRRLIAMVTMLGYSLSFGCSSVREVPMSNEIKSGDKVYAVTLHSGEFVEFDDDGGIVNSYRGTIDGKTRHEKAVSIKLSDVKSLRMDHTDTTKTIAWTVLGAAVVVGVLIAITHNGASVAPVIDVPLGN